MESAPEKVEEEKLLSKYPNLNRRGVAQSVLQKRFNKPQKFFDSGDYNMARAKMQSEAPAAPKDNSKLNDCTGNTIPTPDYVEVVRKRSMQHERPSVAYDEHERAMVVAFVDSEDHGSDSTFAETTKHS